MSDSPKKKRSHRTKSVWVSKKRKRKGKTASEPFTSERKTSLAESDKGSYYNQGDCFSEENEPAPSTKSASRKKSEQSLKTFQQSFNESDTESSSGDSADDVESDFSDSEDEDIETAQFNIPSGLSIVSPDLLQTHLNDAAVCKLCFNHLQVLEKHGSRHGLGTKWIFRCSNIKCPSHPIRVPFSTSQKKGKMYCVNRASVLAFPAIGKGIYAAQKLFSIMNLPQPVSSSPWTKHTKELSDIVENVAEESYKAAVWELKLFKRSMGNIQACTDDELRAKIVDVPTSFDCSWSSRGWSARDGVVAAISEETGKVSDIVYMSSTCGHCKAMEEKRNSDEISRLEFLDWYYQD